jgi:hypothetical protein
MNAPLPRDLAWLHDSDAEPVWPGRLWSLWKMLEFNAVPFYQASITMAYMKSNLKRKESEFRKTLADGSVEITLISDCQFIIFLESKTKELIASLDVLDAKMTLMVAKRLLDHLREGSVAYSDVVEFIDEIEGRLKDELSLAKLLVVESDRQNYYRPHSPIFGVEFDGAI